MRRAAPFRVDQRIVRLVATAARVAEGVSFCANIT
jgi:hypothetical protein